MFGYHHRLTVLRWLVSRATSNEASVAVLDAAYLSSEFSLGELATLARDLHIEWAWVPQHGCAKKDQLSPALYDQYAYAMDRRLGD